MGLCCLGALRGLCGFCAREMFGGLEACGVFASILSFFAMLFVLLSLLSSRYPSLLWLSFFVLLHCFCGSLGVVVVSFSLSVYTQKRALRVGASSLVLLWGCYMFSASLSADSFAFENIHPAPQVR